MNAEIDISSIELETDRLILRPWEITDLEDFYKYASVEGDKNKIQYRRKINFNAFKK